jgi:hypothetical protein
MNTFVSANPFPIHNPALDHEPGERWYQWRLKAEAIGIPCTVMVQIAEEAGLVKFNMMHFKTVVLGFPHL